MHEVIGKEVSTVLTSRASRGPVLESHFIDDMFCTS